MPSHNRSPVLRQNRLGPPTVLHTLMLAVNGVWECAVVGVPDERFGERPVAFVVPTNEHAGDTPALIAQVRAQLQGHLGRLNQPEHIHAIASLPRTATGKVLRRALRDLLTDQPRNNSRTFSSPSNASLTTTSWSA